MANLFILVDLLRPSPNNIYANATRLHLEPGIWAHTSGERADLVAALVLVAMVVVGGAPSAKA